MQQWFNAIMIYEVFSDQQSSVPLFIVHHSLRISLIVPPQADRKSCPVTNV